MKEIINNDNVSIIDVRSEEQFKKGHISNAININFNELLLNYQKYLNKEELYYIYCQKGNKSKIICNIVSHYGYKVVNIIDGYEGLIKRK